MSKLGWAVVIGVGVIALLLGGFMMGWGGGYGGWGMMGGPGTMMGSFGLPMMGGLAMLVFWALVIGGAVWFIQSMTRGSSHTGVSKQQTESPLDILKRRYASGDISKEQFEEMTRNLSA